MKRMARFFFHIAFLIFVCCGNLFAQPPPPPPPDRPPSIDMDISTSAGKPVAREITPSAGPRLMGGVGFFVTGDFIWWRTREDGVGYAFTGLTNPALPPSKGKVHSPDFKWEPGFKVGAGLNFRYDDWDLYANYTWLHTGSNKSQIVQDPQTSTIFPLWNTNVTVNPSDRYTFASGAWKLYFNVLDLELGRHFFVSQFLAFRPFFGLKGTWQTQKLRVRYDYLDPLFGQANREKMGQKMDYWGIGIRGGLDGGWYFVRNFCLFGNLALTALWTDFDIDRQDTHFSEMTMIDATMLSTRNDFTSLKPVLEFILGLRWDIWWNENKDHFSLAAAWEEQIWWSFNQFLKVQEESAHGDLTFQGLTVKARFDF